MPHDLRKTLFDIGDAIAKLEAFTRGRTVENYSADVLLQAAVERMFTIIGEAMTRLRQDHPGTLGNFASYRNIIAFRNLIVHAYDLIDDLIVWQIVVDDFPAFGMRLPSSPRALTSRAPEPTSPGRARRSQSPVQPLRC